MNKNKGFSLVELIVVVAIMAVLVGILAPAYLSYVEKTRRGTDEDSAEEVRRAVEIATADICVYEAVRGGGVTVTCANDTKISACTSNTTLSQALVDAFGDKKFSVKSKYYDRQTYNISISTPSGGTVGSALVVTGCWSGHN